jgi:epoxyqueuosine reductase
MRGKLVQLRKCIEKLVPRVETRIYVDTGPILERAFARLAGIGWVGKNTCLINERRGSWFFLGVILTNLELDSDPPTPDRCGSCIRCLQACPTGALVEPYVMDASRCISYFNIELKGAIPEEFRVAMGANVFGCDICQDVCPWNNRPLSVVSGLLPSNDAQRAETTGVAEFQPMQVEVKARDSGLATRDWGLEPCLSPESQHPPAGFSLFNPTLQDLVCLTEKDFGRVFAHSPIKRAKYRGWLRNLCVATGNSGNSQLIPWLEEMAQHPDLMVQEHAGWALRKLSAISSPPPVRPRPSPPARG